MDLFDLYAKISLDDSGFNEGVGKAKGSFSTLQSIGVGAFTAIQTVGATAMAAIGSAITLVGGAVVALGKIGLEYNSQMENYTTNFSVMLGSMEAAAAKVDELKVMAAKTPFGMGDLADATQTLLAFQVPAEETTGILSMLGDVALGNSEKLAGLAVVFGQVSSAGKLQGQDLMQLINQGFNPLNYIAQRTGESMEQLRDRMAAGKITAEEVAQAFKDATSEGGAFYKGMEAASQTLSGLLSTLEDNAKSLVGSVFMPISDALKNTVVPAAIGAIDELQTAFNNEGIPGLISAAGEMMGQLIVTITSYIPQVVDGAASIVSSLLHELIRRVGDIRDAGSTLLTSLLEAFSTIGPQLATLLSGIAPTIVEFFLAFKEQAFELGLMIITFFLDGLAKNMDSVTSTMGDLLSRLVSALTTNLPILVGAAVEIVTALAQFIADNASLITEGISTIISSLVGGIGEALPVLIPAAIQIILVLVQALADNIPILLEAAVQLINGLTTGLTAALPVLIPAVIQIVLSIVQALVENAPLLIDAAMQLINGLASGLLEALPVLIDALPGIIQGLVTALVAALPTLIEGVIALVLGIVNALPSIITMLVQALPSIIQLVVTALVTALPMLVQGAVQLVLGLVAALPDIILALIEAMPYIIEALVSALIGASAALIQAGVALVEALIVGINDSWLDLVSNAGDKVSGLFDSLAEWFEGAIERGKEFVDNLWSGIKENWEELKTNVSDSIQGVIDTVGDFIQNFIDIGADIVGGIWEGIENAWDGLVEWFSGIWNDLVGGVKDFLGIASPSKLFAGIGAMMAQGVGIGFELQMPKELPNITGALGIDEISAYTSETPNSSARAAAPQFVLNQNLYTQAMTPSQAMAEAEYAFERAVMAGVPG